MQNLNRRKNIAKFLFSSEHRPINIRKIFEGRWVNIMVATGPIFLTSLEETIPLIPPTILQPNKINPTDDVLSSNFLS